jgi:DNA polymerase III alpha subunit
LFGKRQIEYPHQLLEPVLKETFGTFIYQEQVLKAAVAMGGFTPEQADQLRHSITKARFDRDFTSMRDSFCRQSARRGVSHDTAVSVFDMMAKFASFGFCKAHAATYAVLSYRGSFLKAHYPVEYMTAMLNNFAGYYLARVYAEEARRWGAKLMPPTIDRPSDVCFVDGQTLYIGMLFVRNMSGATIDRMAEERAKGSYINLFDFLARVRPSIDEVENLIKCGAMDCLGRTRPELLWLLKMYGERRLKIPDDSPMLGGLSIPEPEPEFLPNLADYSIDQRLKAEADILEMAITCHPIERLGITNNHVKSIDLPKLENRKVKIAGLVADRKRIKTNNGKHMVFLSMEDEFDMFEVTLFPGTYQRVGERIFRKPLLDIEGIVQYDSGGLSVVADKVTVIE